MKKSNHETSFVRGCDSRSGNLDGNARRPRFPAVAKARSMRTPTTAGTIDAAICVGLPNRHCPSLRPLDLLTERVFDQ